MDAFGDGAKGDMEGGGRRSCNCSCPSKTDCLRAWGWSSGRLGDLARGAMIREDDVPGTGSRVHDHELKLQVPWQIEIQRRDAYESNPRKVLTVSIARDRDAGSGSARPVRLAERRKVARRKCGGE